jgi:hypothetical protein
MNNPKIPDLYHQHIDDFGSGDYLLNLTAKHHNQHLQEEMQNFMHPYK